MNSKMKQFAGPLVGLALILFCAMGADHHLAQSAPGKLAVLPINLAGGASFVTGATPVANGGTGLSSCANGVVQSATGTVSCAALNMAGGSSYVTGVLPAGNRAASTFAEVNSALASANASVSLNSQKIVSVADPSSAQDAMTKAYADAHYNTGGIGAGTYAACIAQGSPATGWRCAPKDGGFDQVYSDAAWHPLIRGIMGTTPGDGSTYATQVNHGTSVLTRTNGVLNVTTISSGAVVELHLDLASISCPSACEVQFRIDQTNLALQDNSGNLQFVFAGICLRESGTGNIAAFTDFIGTQVENSVTVYRRAWAAQRWTDATTRVDSPEYNGAQPQWGRIKIASSLVNWDLSADKATWTTMRQTAIGNVFGGVPNQVGPCYQAYQATANISYLDITTVP